MYYLLAILLTSGLISSTLGQTKCTTEKAREADSKVGQSFIIGTTGQLCPTNPKDGEEYCRTLKATRTYLKQYSRGCLNGLRKQVTSLLSTGAKNQYDVHCINSTQGLALMDKMLCMNKNIEGCHKCMNTYIIQLQEAEHAESEMKFPLLCCKFYEMRNCVAKTLKDVCNKDSVDTLSSFITRFASETMDLVCSRWAREPEKCKPVNVNITKKKKRFISIYAPLMNLLESL